MSDTFIIKGGRPLSGVTDVRGSKNTATKMMIASLLTDEPCVIENTPFSADVDITREICESIGSEVAFEDGHRCRIETGEIKTSVVSELSRRNRIPILALGPLLHRRGFAEVPVLGGCPIGHRPINFHVEALTKMGVRIERRTNSYYAEAERIRGAEIEFLYPSVGATENVILCAVLAEGRTILRNAAVEPEILNLTEMLNAMGARISCDAKRREMVIDGVTRLRGITVRVMPDRNEIVSFASAALATGGDILVRGAGDSHLQMFLGSIRGIGGAFVVEEDGIRFKGSGPYKGVEIETAPHPGFMTDWQQPFCVLLTQAEGPSIIHETVYEDRFGYVRDLKRMGADIDVSRDCPGARCRFFGQTFNHSVRINGPRTLRGAEIAMTDIRAGIALVIAALAAEGKSVITGVEHIDRGYEKIDERLRALGADIKRLV